MMLAALILIPIVIMGTTVMMTQLFINYLQKKGKWFKQEEFND